MFNKIFKNSKKAIDEVQAVIPEPFKHGQIKKIPYGLNINPPVALLNSHFVVVLLIYILIPFLGFLHFCASIFATLLVLLLKIFPKILGQTMYKIMKTRYLVQDGRREFNENRDFAKAKYYFEEAKKISSKEFIPFINYCISECLGYLEDYNELYTFIQENELEYKRSKVFMIKALLANDINDVKNYFDEYYPVQELKKHPVLLGILLITLSAKNNPKETLEYIDNNYKNVIEEQWSSEELSHFNEMRARMYIGIGEIDKAKQLLKTISNSDYPRKSAQNLLNEITIKSF